MKLTVLGAQGTWPGAGGECSGYLVSHDGFHLWMDAGTGTFARLQEEVSAGEIGSVLISHGHADHFIDMIPAFYARHYGKLGGPGLPCFSPEGFMDLAALLVSENGRNVLAEAFAFTHVADGETFETGPFRITAFEMTHIGVYSLGYRIEVGGASLSYTGDTGPCDAAVDVAKGADLFLCEATYQNDSTLTYFHLSAAQAAEHAARAGVGRLLLTHLTPDLDGSVSREQAAAVWEGAVDVAVPGSTWEVAG
jgi:ribonuclease BN (tRNA processing enzyme)